MQKSSQNLETSEMSSLSTSTAMLDTTLSGKMWDPDLLNQLAVLETEGSPSDPENLEQHPLDLEVQLNLT